MIFREDRKWRRKRRSQSCTSAAKAKTLDSIRMTPTGKVKFTHCIVSLVALLMVVLFVVSLDRPRAVGANSELLDVEAPPQPLAAVSVDSPLISPSPRDYVDLYERACKFSQQVVSKSDLLQLYETEQFSTRPGNGKLRQFIKTCKLERECRRELQAWRYKYLDEDGLVQVRDESIDERLANVAYLVRTNKYFAVDTQRHDWGDKQVDANNMQLVAGPQVDDDLCGQQLRQMVSLIEQLAQKTRLKRALTLEPEVAAAGSLPRQQQVTQDSQSILTDQDISLAKVLDSFGRPESGYLYGRLMSAGSYHQCRINSLILNETSQTRMRYCWAHLKLDKHLDVTLRRRFRDHFETPVDVLSTGICVPQACHSKSFIKYGREFQALLDSQFKLPESMYIDQTLPIESIYCLVDDNSAFKVPPIGQMLIAFLVGWPLLALLVTLCRRRGRRGRQHRQARNGSGGGGDDELTLFNEERYRLKAIERDENGESSATKTTTTMTTKMTSGSRVSLWAALDLCESWNDFVGETGSAAAAAAAAPRVGKASLVELNALNVVKVFGCVFVVIAHSMAIFIGFSMDEVRLSKSLEEDPLIQVVVAGTLVVDTFFAITGILWAYLTLKHLHKLDQNENCNNSNSSSNNNSSISKQAKKQTPGVATSGWRFFYSKWFQLSLIRYLRIVPLFVLVHWFKKFVIIYAGSGPLWDHGMNARTSNGACHHESLWTPFTFASAYYPLSAQCTFQSWSVSNDLFFAILAPPIIFLLYKRPRLASWLTATILAVGYPIERYAIDLVPAHVDEELRELRSFGFYRFFDRISRFYTAPHYRIFGFIFGLWGGYYLYRYQLNAPNTCSADSNSTPQQTQKQKQRKQVKQQQQQQQHSPHSGACWPGWLRGPATWMSVGYLVFIIAAFANSKLLKSHADPLQRYIYPEFLTSIRSTWALANVIVFVRMMTDWKDCFLMRLSGSKFFQVLIKLNYAILLIHLDLIWYTFQANTVPPNDMSIWSFTNLGCGVLLACIPLSIFVHVVYENTLDKLIRLALAPTRQHEKIALE